MFGNAKIERILLDKSGDPSAYFLDKFVAPHLSELTRCGALEVPKRTGWIPAYILNTGFRQAYPETLRQLAMGFLRRAEMAFYEYEAGVESLRAYLEGKKSRVSLYFLALHHFETFLAQAYQAASHIHAIGKREEMFRSGDGSPLDCLNKLYNASKHSDERIERGEFPDGAMLSIWISNDGLACQTSSLSFSDIAENLTSLSEAADFLVDPVKVAEFVKASRKT